MNKFLKELLAAMQNLTVGMNEGKVPMTTAVKLLTELTVHLQKVLDLEPVSVDEKLDFLIFMSSKFVDLQKVYGVDKQVIITGHELFKQWQKAKADHIAGANKKVEQAVPQQPLKPIPEEGAPNP